MLSRQSYEGEIDILKSLYEQITLPLGMGMVSLSSPGGQSVGHYWVLLHVTTIKMMRSCPMSRKKS